MTLSSATSHDSAKAGFTSVVTPSASTNPSNMKPVINVEDVSLATTLLKVLGSEIEESINVPPYFPISAAETVLMFIPVNKTKIKIENIFRILESFL